MAVCAVSSGCRHRAYSDVYVENMAAEIRDLEDQLYEYDYQYKLLEQELQSVRSQRHQLSPGGPATMPGLQMAPSSQGPTPAPLEFRGRDDFNDGPFPLVPDPIPMEGTLGTPRGSLGGAEELDTPGTILEGNPQMPSTDSGTPPNAGDGSTGSAGDANANPGSGDSTPSRDVPPGLRSGGNSNDVLPDLPDIPSNPFPGDGEGQPTSIDDDFNLSPEELVPPLIEVGEPTPPPTTIRAQRTGGQPAIEDALERNLGRIELPAQLASQSKVIEPQPATLQPARKQVKDARVVEVAFHPSYSRAENFDSEPDDDGLVLLLQPVNDAGVMVPVAADLSIVVLDPARESPISQRSYTANEVRAKMQPIGSKQGIYLTLPWNGPDPKADRVVVFATYTFPDGKRVIGEKTIFVTGKDGVRTVWAPRATNVNSSSLAGESTASRVATASFRQAVASDSNRVVRPANSPQSEPAPSPR